MVLIGIVKFIIHSHCTCCILCYKKIILSVCTGGVSIIITGNHYLVYVHGMTGSILNEPDLLELFLFGITPHLTYTHTPQKQIVFSMNTIWIEYKMINSVYSYCPPIYDTDQIINLGHHYKQYIASQKKPYIYIHAWLYNSGLCIFSSMLLYISTRKNILLFILHLSLNHLIEYQ